ncbi:MAG: site-specific integrase [Acidimicrobiia bacterium]|nr:site-specific integrase [Acidimicrobiia bacterium]
MAKRSNSTGSIYYNASRDRWDAKVTLGRNPDGTLKRRTFTAKTQREVAKRLREALDAHDNGLDIGGRDLTVETFGRWWATELLPGEGLAPRTETWYRQTLEAYVLPHVGNRRLTGPGQITPGDVEAMTAKLAKQGYSHRVQVVARTVLGKVLRAAEVRGFTTRNAARLAKSPRDRGDARDVKALTKKELGKLLTALEGTRWYAPTAVAATTGLRPGEVLALHWPDVDLGDDPHVSVRHALQWISPGPEPHLKAPKRNRSYRTVPLPDSTVGVLKAWRTEQKDQRVNAGELWRPVWDDLVFTAPNGAPLKLMSWRQAMSRAMKGTHPHRLRHTYATHLISSGVPIAHVAELLGDSVAVVDSTYSHVVRIKSETRQVADGLLG